MDDNRKLLGIIGGMGSVAAAHFFKRFIERSPARRDQDYIEVVLHNNSQIPDRTDALVNGGADPRPELLRSCRLLDDAGAKVIVLACMTSHAYLSDLQSRTRAEILDGMAETARYCREQFPATRRVGVLATTGTLTSGVLHRALAAEGLEVVAFTGADQDHHFTQPVYADWGVKAGNTNGQARERLVAAGRELTARGADLIIAGCTEVPVVLRPEDMSVPLVDVTEVIVGSAIARCRPRVFEKN